MLGQAHRGLRRKLAETVYLIDSTSLPLSNLCRDWARFSAFSVAAKLHVIYDPDADCPIYAAVTPARVNDVSIAQRMPIEPGATYVFDLGYYDYRLWAKLDAQGCRIVTRFKANTPLDCVETRPVEKDGPVLSDQIGFLPSRQAKSRQNPMQAAVREICVVTETGKLLRILSNDLDADAKDIAALYKRRWAIELLFRWIKQNLRITRFLGTSENAIRMQIAIALIAFLLLRLAQNTQQTVKSPLAFLRLVRINLMQRKRIDRLLLPELTTLANQAQLSLL
jgi:IS4 transposase